MLRKFYLLCLVISFCGIYAEDKDINVQWDLHISNKMQSEVRSCAVSENGEFYLGSVINCNKLFFKGADMHTMKLDPKGNILWQKKFGYSHHTDGHDDVTKLFQSSKGDVFLLSSSETIWDSNRSRWKAAYNEEGRCRIIKYSKDGKYLWTRSFGDMSKIHPHAIGRDMIEVSKGRYIIIGGNGSMDPPWIFMINDDGSMLWQKYLDKNSSYDLRTICRGDYNSYMIWGLYVDKYRQPYNPFYFKIDEEGNLIEKEIMQDILIDSYAGAIKTDDDCYVIAGTTNGDADIMKFDRNLNLLWRKNYGNMGRDCANDVILSADGGYIICGEFKSGKVTESKGWGGIQKSWSISSDDFWVFKLDRDGELVWNKIIVSPTNESAKTVAEADDGSILAAGYLGQNQWEHISGEIKVVKIENPDFVGSKFDLLKQRNNETSALNSFFADKDEFETDIEHKQRIEKGKAEKKQIEKKYELNIDAARARFSETYKKEMQIQKQETAYLIRQSIEEIVISIDSIGTYNAESECFPVTVNGFTENIKIPRSEARSFKENLALVEVAGYKKLLPGLKTYEYYNLKIIHPVSRNRYPFGLQKSLYEMPDGNDRPMNNLAVTPPNLQLNCTLKEQSGNGFLEGGEEGKLVVEIANTGKGPAFGVIVDISIADENENLTYSRTRIAGEIAPDKKETVEFGLTADEAIGLESHRFNISAMESNGFSAAPIIMNFQSRPLELAEISLIDYGITTASGDSEILPGETATLTLRMQNLGMGAAEDMKYNMILPDNVYFNPESKQSYSLAELSSGKFHDLEFMILTSNEVNEQIELSVAMTSLRTAKNFPFSLEINKPLKSITEFVQAGIERENDPVIPANGFKIDIAKDIPAGRSINKNAVAIVIGNRNYLKAKEVDFAINDAEIMKQYLVTTFGIKEGNIFFLKNAGKGDFELFFGTAENYKGKLFNQIKPEISDLFIFYSGHGAPSLKNNKGYFVPVECDPNYVELGGYSLDTFYKNLAHIPARSVTVVLDACFSGSDIFENISPIITKTKNPIIKLDNGLVFTSSSKTQVSSWYNDKKHGMFTYFFLKAIHNKNADQNGDNKLTAKEIFQYTTDNAEGVPYYSRSIHGVDQNPQLMGKNKEKSLVEFK